MLTKDSAITPATLPLVRVSEREIALIVAVVPGGAANIEDVYPLTPIQNAVLARYRTAEQGAADVLPFLTSFERRDDVERFLEALRELIARHEILRTAIVWEQLAEPVQVVLRVAPLPVQEVRLEATADAGAFIAIDQAPMLRTFIAYDLVADRWLLMLVSHHLMLLHTGLEAMLREVGLIPAGRRDAPPIPEPAHEAFFRQLLGDVDEVTTPYGLTRVQGAGAGRHESSLTLDATLTSRLRERARLQDISTAAIFHLAWAMVLAHASARTDVVFGTLLVDRFDTDDAAPRTVGKSVNILPMRVKLDSATVASALGQTQTVLADIRTHHHASLALAQQCSRVSAPAPLFSALLRLREAASTDATDAWLRVERLFTPERDDYPLVLTIDDRAAEVLLTVRVDAPTEAAAICRSMETALAGLLAALESAPDTAVRTIRVLSPEDYERVTTAPNQTTQLYPSGTADDFFAQQVARTPDETAVISSRESLSYAQLDARADEIARVLIALGVPEQSVIGVLLERSASTIVSLLAILKIGCAYLPLEPSYPPDRIAHMVADSDAQLVITNAELGTLLPASVAQFHIDSPIEIAADTLAKALADAPALREHTAADVAYIIYTSGSTGKPKGVAVPHSAAVNLAFARSEHDPVGTGDRILAAISVGFDVSIGQLLLPLLRGATIVVAEDLRTLSARDFWEFVGAYGVTHINAVSSFFESIVDAVPPTSALVRLMLGGEPLAPSLVRRIRRVLPHTQVLNMYGPTEACIDATYYIATGNETSAVLPIGKPLPNYRAYILDALLEPVGIGVAGDLYLSGAGLATGYVNAPELTAQRFLPDPFGAPGERIYHTGDRARRLADGLIEFLGRADSQVKIRGHRIELGEIAAELAAVDGVNDVTVLVREDMPGERRLVAYYTANEPLSGAVLRAAAGAALPSYMVPGAYVWLASFPLTTNGKLDRRAFPAPDVRADVERAADIVRNGLRNDASEGAGPSGVDMDVATDSVVRAMEGVLAALVGEMLGRAIGRNDDLFALGFHSLSAIRLVDRIDRTIDVRVPLRAVYDEPTIARLALRITSAQKAVRPFEQPKPVETLNAHGTRVPFFYLHNDLLADGIYCRRLATAVGDALTIFALAPHGTVGLPLMFSVETMARDYLIRIRSLQPHGPYRLGGLCAGGLVAFEVARLLEAQGEMVERLLLINALPVVRRSNAVVDTIIRKIAFDSTVPLRFRELFCYNVVDLFEALGDGPRGLLPFLGDRVRALLRRLKLIPPRPVADSEIFEERHGATETESIIAHLVAPMTYHPQPYGGELTLFWGTDERFGASVAKAKWRGLVKALRFISIPGGPMSPVQEGVDELGRSLSELLP